MKACIETGVKSMNAKGYDDIGSGKYDYLPIGKRIPIHAKKAEEFLKKGDFFNARIHAGKCHELCARGWIGTEPYKRAAKVLKEAK
jgi:hypothetical protein